MKTKLLLLLLAPAMVFGQAEDPGSDEDAVRAVPNLPAGFSVPASTVSPDGRYGVTVPDRDHYEKDETVHNQIVEVSSGRILAAIKADAGLLHMNHGGIAPSRWSTDSSILLWQVEGKWSPRALVLVRIQNGAVKWQTNVLKTAQQEILVRTKKAAAAKYAAAKKENAGNGSAYPDGFTVNVTAAGTSDDLLSFPVAVHAELTSNPKAIEDFPKSAQLDANLDAMILEDGKLTVKSFNLGAGKD